MADLPKIPAWLRWTLQRLLSPQEYRLILDELQELHTHWSNTEGREAADRRYLRQLRQYPLRLLARRLQEWKGYRQGFAPFRAVKQALRSLSRVPALSVAIVTTVGIGIGGCTAIFAVIDVLFIRPLPYPDADRLVRIYNDAPQFDHPFSVVDFQALSEEQTSFEAVAAFRFWSFAFTAPDRAERVSVASVTPGYLELLGIELLAGRPPGVSEGDPAGPPTIVITPGFAARYMGISSPNAAEALGESVTLGGFDFTVLGVVPDDFGPLTRWAEAFTTLQMTAPTRKGPFFLSVFGRLKEGIDPAVAQEELHVMNERLFPLWADSYQDEDTTWGMQPVRELLQGDVDQLLLILMGSVGLLLLTATANATNLLLARIAGRRKEFAVRSSMGAPRWRILSLLLTESGILAAGGVTVGLLLAFWAMDLLPTFASGYLPRLEELRLSGPVLAFAGTLAMASGLLFGMVSALQGSRGDLEGELKAGARNATAGRGRQRVQGLLVVGQIALAIPLLAGAALLLTSFANLYRSELGVDMEGYLSVTVTLDQSRYPDPGARNAFWDEVGTRMETVPGVRSLGLGTGRPPARAGMTNNFDLEDHPTPPGSTEPTVPWLFVDNEYFGTLGIPHLAGRLFEPSDLDTDAPPVVLVDEAWAQRFFPGQEVLGRRLKSGGCTTCPFTTVVGVVGTVPYQGVESSNQGAVYGPGARGWLTRPILHIRTAGDPALLIPRIREELRAMDPGIPLTDFSTGESLLMDSLQEPRHLSLILSSFSAVALLLAVVGLYGILAYSVHQRRGDIAIRMALGGTSREVLGMVVRQGMVLVVVGLVLGSAGALAFTGILSDLLFQVEANDPLVLGGVVLLLASVSLISCILPGIRAVGIEPASTLQEE